MGKHSDGRDMGDGKHSQDTTGDGHKKGPTGPFVRPEERKDGGKKDR